MKQIQTFLFTSFFAACSYLFLNARAQEPHKNTMRTKQETVFDRVSAVASKGPSSGPTIFASIDSKRTGHYISIAFLRAQGESGGLGEGASPQTLETFSKISLQKSTLSPGGGVLDLNLYGDVHTKKNFFHRAPEFLPSNDTLF